MDEIWKQIKGWEGLYSVSSLGRVRSDRVGKFQGLIMKSIISKKGYPYVSFYNLGRKKTTAIHSLVARAFIGKRPLGLIINHKDTVKVNNNYLNLEYVTPKENVQHGVRNGCRDNIVHGKGEESSHVKLTNMDVLLIRNLYAPERGSRASLARKFNISPSTVRDIIRRRTWKHI